MSNLQGKCQRENTILMLLMIAFQLALYARYYDLGSAAKQHGFEIKYTDNPKITK